MRFFIKMKVFCPIRDFNLFDRLLMTALANAPTRPMYRNTARHVSRAAFRFRRRRLCGAFFLCTIVILSVIVILSLRRISFCISRRV